MSVLNEVIAMTPPESKESQKNLGLRRALPQNPGIGSP
jgi:hypothetical protein